MNAVQQARRMAAAQQVKEGKVKFPLVCGHCGSKSVTTKDLRSEAARQEDEHDPDIGTQFLYCVSCGRRTSLETAHRVRLAQLRDFIEKGVDVQLGKRTVKQK